MFALDPTIFDMFKQRATVYANKGYPRCDSKMIPILEYLNKHPGLATVFCCEGHENFIPEDVTIPFARYPYILLAYTAEGKVFLEEFVNKVMTALTNISIENLKRISLKYTPRIVPATKFNIHYIAASFSFDSCELSNCNTFYQAIHEVIQNHANSN